MSPKAETKVQVAATNGQLEARNSELLARIDELESRPPGMNLSLRRFLVGMIGFVFFAGAFNTYKITTNTHDITTIQANQQGASCGVALLLIDPDVRLKLGRATLAEICPTIGGAYERVARIQDEIDAVSRATKPSNSGNP